MDVSETPVKRTCVISMAIWGFRRQWCEQDQLLDDLATALHTSRQRRTGGAKQREETPSPTSP